MDMPKDRTRREKGLGIVSILGAALFFALMNAFVNLAGELPTMQKVFFRNAFAAAIVFFMLLFEKEKFRVRKGCLKWLFLRAFFGFIGVILNFYAIDNIGSISDASILNKLSPFFAIIFSAALLKERPKPFELVFAGIAFLGALFVIRPTFDLRVLPAAAGFFSGACAGLAYTCVRVLGMRGERSLMTIFFFSAFSTVVSLPFFLAFYVPMSGMQWLFLVLAGVSAAGGQFFITAAYRHAPAKEIAVFDYAQVPFAALLGFLLLGELPDPMSYAGYAVIIAAAIGKSLYGRRAERKEKERQERERRERANGEKGE